MIWPAEADRIIRRIETAIRVLTGSLSFVELTEEDDIALMPLIRAHKASGQNVNVVYVEELNKVVWMAHDPKVCMMVSEDGRMELVKDYSESDLTVTGRS